MIEKLPRFDFEAPYFHRYPARQLRQPARGEGSHHAT